MAWEKVHEEINEAEGMHLVVLRESTSQAEHHLMIHLEHDSCPTCGHVKAKENLNEIDVRALIASEIAALNDSTERMRAYARKHKVPTKKTR